MPATMILGPDARRRRNADPSMFGRYRLLRRLDGGGMADIYTAVLDGAEGFQRTLRHQAIAPGADPQPRRRRPVHRRGASWASMLTHPNIVPVFDFGKVGDEYFMAEEFVLGRDITRLLQRHQEVEGRPLSERFMLYVAHEVAGGAGLRPRAGGRRRRAAGHRSPRRLAGQHHDHRARRREAPRLRHRPGDRRACRAPRPAS